MQQLKVGHYRPISNRDAEVVLPDASDGERLTETVHQLCTWWKLKRNLMATVTVTDVTMHGLSRMILLTTVLDSAPFRTHRLPLYQTSLSYRTMHNL